MHVDLSESHKATLELLSNNTLKNPLSNSFYSDLGDNWAGPSEVKRTIEKFIACNPLEIYYISPQIFSELTEGILKQRLINNVKAHVSNKNGLVLFPQKMQPLDLEEINNDENPQYSEFDSLFFTAMNNYDYWLTAWEMTEQEITEEFSNPETERQAGTLCIVPISHGFVNTISSHLSTNNGFYLDDYDFNERETYVNIMDFTLLFLYLLDMNVIKGKKELYHGNNRITTFL